MLARYLDSWIEANPAKIADATTDDYDFHDPLVGHLSRSTLPRYFMLLRSRFAMVGVSSTRDLAFRFHGSDVERCPALGSVPILARGTTPWSDGYRRTRRERRTGRCRGRLLRSQHGKRDPSRPNRVGAGADDQER
jgi:hypothetical protein